MKALRFIGCILAIGWLCVGCNNNGKSQKDDTSLDSGTARDSSRVTIASDSGTSSAVGPDTSSHTADTLQTDTETDTADAPGDCSGVVCNEPPANQCDATSGLIVYNATGWCSQGTCHYIPGTATCDGACVNGVCEGNPCQAVLCNNPPEPECLGDTNVLRVYGRNGSCSALSGAPQCTYASEDVVCDGGCADGQCIDAPCAHVTCDDPPARYCDGNNLITWNNISRCEAGECIYEAQIVPCSSGCQDGACIDKSPCEAVTCTNPPAPYCADGVTLRTFKAEGTCQDGFCFYAPVDVVCATHCEAGQCAGDPCAGVDCSNGPPMYCDPDGVTLISWDGLSGTCNAGVCNYGLQTTPCAAGCESGSCRNNPCGGVTCDAPPADYCTGAQSAVQYVSPGICVGDGSCAYQSSPVSCPMGCDLGICLTGSETGDTDTPTQLDTVAVVDTTGDTSLDTNADTGTIADSDTGATPTDSDSQTTADTDTEIVLFFEDFENEPSWFADNGLWAVGENSNAPSATHVTATNPDGNYTGIDSRFISPSIVLPLTGANQVLELRFTHWFRIGGATRGYVQVQESTGPGQWGDWTTLETGFGGDAATWTGTMRDLSAYAGSTLRLAFFFDYVDGSVNRGWYVDDITIRVE